VPETTSPGTEAPVPTSGPPAGRLWLAPLTVGGNLPFRRLCSSFGADVTVGEMVMIRRLLKGEGSEFALLRSHPEEPCFGVQLADRDPATLAEAARIAESRGARFVDLNCGCPIHEITRRGLGADLLKRPKRIGSLVSAMVAAVRVPVTVKIRAGWSASAQNACEVARVCEEAGASALTIHGRSREGRYTQAADWELVGRVASERCLLVVGNGDILTHYEAEDRVRRSGVRSVMLARGALVKPWLFRELRESRSWLPTADERFSVLWRFVLLLRDHFGVDERGRKRCHRFLAWHLDFFSRYRPLPEEGYLEASRRHPLLQTRIPPGTGHGPLETLLRDPRNETHLALADVLLDAASEEEACDAAGRLQAGLTAYPGEAEGPSEVAQAQG
jgi:tRNA-dihydrouridine synthase 3